VPIDEYQLCFKCHSSWTTQPAGQSDLALLLNNNNPSYHPVEAAGRDPLIASGAFEEAGRLMSVGHDGDRRVRRDGPPNSLSYERFARRYGLDYYTGSVFETFLLDLPGFGSVMSGGRYDRLISTFLGRDMPAVGISVGRVQIVVMIGAGALAVEEV
jgi:hypothetical protein